MIVLLLYLRLTTYNMKNLLSKINIQVNKSTYLKDPQTSDLGKKILRSGVDLIEHIGFEAFTFRKLAKEIGSTEASVYRYFESKHKLLIYLTSWYWGWMEYKLVLGIANVTSPKDRLEKTISLLTEKVEEDGFFDHINETKLHRIVIAESSKVYLTKEVDEENKEGAFIGYKDLVSRVSDIILEINPNYKYPHMLISTVIEGAHHQRFFSIHLPRLTDSVDGEDAITTFYNQIVFKAIEDK